MAKSSSLFGRYNDVTILGKNFENALENLREVLGRFADHNLKLKPKKCHLNQK